MCHRSRHGIVPEYNGHKNEVDESYEKDAENVISEFENHMKEYEIANALQSIWTFIARTNKYIDETSPWVLAKNVDGEGEEEKKEKEEKLKSSMYHLIAGLKEIAILIRPFMNDTSDNILRQIGVDSKTITFDSLKDFKELKNIKVIEKGEPIFMRLNNDEEVEYIKNLMKK